MTTRFRPAAVVAAVIVSALPLSALAESQTLTVDCSRGQTIAKALERGDSRKPLVVIIRGTCNESVTIHRDDTTLAGDPRSGGMVNGPTMGYAINVSADRVTITGLRVTGGGGGVNVLGGSNVGIVDSVIEHTGGEGVMFNSTQAARIRSSKVQHTGSHGVMIVRAAARLINNEIAFNAGAGVHVEQMGNLFASANKIGSNGSNGIELLAGSYGAIHDGGFYANGTNPAGRRHGIFVSFSRADIGPGNSIFNHPGAGIWADGSTVQAGGNEVSGNGDGGITGYLGSTLVVYGMTITNNTGDGVRLVGNTTGQIDSSTVRLNTGHGIVLQRGSKLLTAPPVSDATANGGFGLYCADAESSVADLASLNGTVSQGCTGF